MKFPRYGLEKGPETSSDCPSRPSLMTTTPCGRARFAVMSLSPSSVVSDISVAVSDISVAVSDISVAECHIQVPECHIQVPECYIQVREGGSEGRYGGSEDQSEDGYC